MKSDQWILHRRAAIANNANSTNRGTGLTVDTVQ